MTPNILYARKTLKIKASQSSASDNMIHLPSGTLIGVYAVEILPLPTKIVEIGVQNSQNGDIITPSDVRDYLHKQGGYLQGVKPLKYPTENQQFFINVNAHEPLTADFMVQLVFIINTGCNCSSGLGCTCAEH